MSPVVTKADDKDYVCKTSKLFCPSYTELKIHCKSTNSVDPDEVAHDEPYHRDIRCLQHQKLWLMALEGLIQEICKLVQQKF